MKKSKTIVRTKTTHGLNYKPEEMYYEVNFMTFSRYIERSQFAEYGSKFELFPFKWYDLRRFYQIPAYWILMRLKKSEKDISKSTHKKASTITLLTEVLLLAKPVIELLKSLIP